MRIVSAFGPPCSLCNWGIEFLKKILEFVGEPVELVYKSDIGGLVKAWKDVAENTCVIYADLPDERIVDIYTRTQAPFVMFAEAPLDLVSFLMRERSIPLRDAVSTASIFLSVFQQFGLRDRMLVVTRTSRSVPRLVDAVLDLFAPELAAEVRAETLRRVLEFYGEFATVDELVAQFGALGEPSGASIQRLRPAERTFVEQALSGYFVAGGADAASICWPREAFLLADDPGTQLTGRIELVGPARFLIYGPYFHLPPGEWVATAELEVGDNVTGNVLIVDACGGAEQQLFSLRLPASGLFKFSMPVRVLDAYRPIEMRAFLGEGAIEGWIDWRSVRFRGGKSRAYSVV